MSTLTMIRQYIHMRTHRTLTVKTIGCFSVTSSWLPLKESTPILHKLIRTRCGQCLALKLAYSLHKSGVFCLKLYHLLFESLCPQSEHGISGNVSNEFDDGFHKRVATTPNGYELNRTRQEAIGTDKG